MLKNNRGFLLYDSLISLMILSSMTIFFDQIIVISNQMTTELYIEQDALEEVRKSLYYYGGTGSYQLIDNQVVKITTKEGALCYEVKDQQNKQKQCL